MKNKIPKDVLENLQKPERYPDHPSFYSQIVAAFWTAEIGQTSEFCGVIAAITGKTIERDGKECRIFVTVDFYDKA